FSNRLTARTVPPRSPPHIISDEDPASYSSRTPDPPTDHPILLPVDREIGSRGAVNRPPRRRQRGPRLGPCRYEVERMDRGANGGSDVRASVSISDHRLLGGILARVF